jgi:hypothetical protein
MDTLGRHHMRTGQKRSCLRLGISNLRSATIASAPEARFRLATCLALGRQRGAQRTESYFSSAGTTA